MRILSTEAVKTISRNAVVLSRWRPAGRSNVLGWAVIDGEHHRIVEVATERFQVAPAWTDPFASVRPFTALPDVTLIEPDSPWADGRRWVFPAATIVIAIRELPSGVTLHRMDIKATLDRPQG